MRKHTKLSVQWFYDLLERGECDMRAGWLCEPDDEVLE